MSSELSLALKNDKLTYKAVLEKLFDKNNSLVLEAIRQLGQQPKVTKTLTADEKEARAKARSDKKAYKEKIINDLGGKSKVTEEQIDAAMKLYYKDVKKAKKSKVEKEESSGSDSDNPWDDPNDICLKQATIQKDSDEDEPKKVPKVTKVTKVEPKVEPKDSDEDEPKDSDEDEPNKVTKVTKVEPKVEPKKVTAKKKKTRVQKTPDTESD